GRTMRTPARTYTNSTIVTMAKTITTAMGAPLVGGGSRRLGRPGGAGGFQRGRDRRVGGHPGAGALDVGPPDGRARGDGRAVGRLRPPLLALDPDHAQLAAAGDVLDHRRPRAHQPAGAHALVERAAVEPAGEGAE